jgi:hypothetical protein
MLVFFLFILACSELEDVREHDRRVTEEAETAQRDVRISFFIFIYFTNNPYTFFVSFEQLSVNLKKMLHFSLNIMNCMISNVNVWKNILMSLSPRKNYGVMQPIQLL